ncbi:hypothetical protein P43SY_010359 [Pythium insidiosum]|uniref:RNase H type-1 domain-containing protein n=1 Tax=Pythium insidiosum TaxID=114742 RepID=A0AAD5Q142_PYTIN|nr:hypothetical protein P43SY_010359 [Pythium insidiosum]
MTSKSVSGRCLQWATLLSPWTLDIVTVNEAEYDGMLRGLARARELGIEDVVVVGDSRIAVQQCQGTIGCNEARLQVLLNRFASLRAAFKSLELAHVKSEFNAPADFLASKALQVGDVSLATDVELEQLRGLNKLAAPSASSPMCEGSGGGDVLAASGSERSDSTSAQRSAIGDDHARDENCSVDGDDGRFPGDARPAVGCDGESLSASAFVLTRSMSTAMEKVDERSKNVRLPTSRHVPQDTQLGNQRRNEPDAGDDTKRTTPSMRASSITSAVIWSG